MFVASLNSGANLSALSCTTRGVASAKASWYFRRKDDQNLDIKVVFDKMETFRFEWKQKEQARLAFWRSQGACDRFLGTSVSHHSY